jgi:hypothetical protein
MMGEEVSLRRVRVPPVLNLGFTYVETGEMPLGISSPRCSSYFWWRLVVVWLLMVLRWKEMEERATTLHLNPPQ